MIFNIKPGIYINIRNVTHIMKLVCIMEYKLHIHFVDGTMRLFNFDSEQEVDRIIDGIFKTNRS